MIYIHATRRGNRWYIHDITEYVKGLGGNEAFLANVAASNPEQEKLQAELFPKYYHVLFVYRQPNWLNWSFYPKPIWTDITGISKKRIPYRRITTLRRRRAITLARYKTSPAPQVMFYCILSLFFRNWKPYWMLQGDGKSRTMPINYPMFELTALIVEKDRRRVHRSARRRQELRWCSGYR